MNQIDVNVPNLETLTLSFSERAGEGMPIIFLHGNGFGKHVFDEQFTCSALQGRHLISVDLPGHGNSSNASDPKLAYSYAGLAQIINQFIKRLGHEKCIIAGWSLGGQIAIEMIDSADHVAGVMAFGAAPAQNGPLGLMRSMHFCRVMLLTGKARHTIDDAMFFEQSALLGYGNGRFMENLLGVDEELRPTLSRSVLMRSGVSQREIVEQSQTPIYLMQGAQDELIRTNYMQGLQSDMLYGGKVHILDDCGHAPFVENPDRFNVLLAQFADDVEAGMIIAAPHQDDLAIAS